MVIGVFYSEVGSQLLRFLYRLEPRASEIRKELWVKENWSKGQFTKAGRLFKKYNYQVVIQLNVLVELRSFLMEKRGPDASLAGKPLPPGARHLHRLDVGCFSPPRRIGQPRRSWKLPEKDLAHLAGDLKRAMGLAVPEWLLYLRHLKENYPYLYSLEVRKNLFDPQASPVVN